MIKNNISNSANSPLRYPGGKGKITKFVANLLEINKIDGTYIEPFAGGAGVAINLLLSNKVTNIVINDLDDGVYSFWKTIVDEPQKLIKKIEDVPFDYYDKDVNPDLLINYWLKVQARYKSGTYANRVNKAFDFFMLNRMNVSGIVGGGPIGGHSQSGKYNITSRFNKASLIKKIELIATYHDRILVTNQEASFFLEKHITRIGVDLDNTFFFVDPPYYEQGRSLYNSFASDTIHQKIATSLIDSSILKYWILTYDTAPQISALYSDADIQRFNYDIQYNANKRGKFGEFLFASPMTRVLSFDNVLLETF